LREDEMLARGVGQRVGKKETRGEVGKEIETFSSNNSMPFALGSMPFA